MKNTGGFKEGKEFYSPTDHYSRTRHHWKDDEFLWFVDCSTANRAALAFSGYIWIPKIRTQGRRSLYETILPAAPVKLPFREVGFLKTNLK